MPTYAKPYLTLPDQLALVKSRGLQVADDAAAIESLHLPSSRLKQEVFDSTTPHPRQLRLQSRHFPLCRLDISV